MEGLLKISTMRQKGLVVIVCTGELDMSSSERLRDQVEGGLEDGMTALVLDGSGITFIDSMGVRCLLHLATTCGERGIPFSLVQNPRIRRVVEAMGVADRLPVPDATAV